MLSDPYRDVLISDYLGLNNSNNIVKLYRSVIVDPPRVEPVVAEDVLDASRIKMDLPSNLSDAKIASAREIAEDVSGKALVARTIDFIYDSLGRQHEFDYPPVRAILGAWGTDVNNVETEIPKNYYFLQPNEFGGRLIFDPASSWAFFPRDFDCMRIRVLCGYVIPCSVDLVTSSLQAVHDFKNGDQVRLSISGGSPPDGLEARNEKYYAVNVTPNSLQLAASPGGTPIAITSKGTGRLFLGEIPDTILRAILEIAASDVLSEGYDPGQATLGVSANSLPASAIMLLRRKRKVLGA